MKNIPRMLAALLFLLPVSGAEAQEWIINRYGLELIERGGAYVLKDEARIRGVGIFDFDALPADFYTPYAFRWIFLQDYDAHFRRCRTETHTYKVYPGYRLDLQVDIPPGEGPFPFIVWIHGGGWEAGSYVGHEEMSRFLASHGIGGVRINYTLLPQGGTMPVAWSDIQDALRFAIDHAERFRLNPRRFGFAGQSAGAHLAAYAAMRTEGTRLLVAMNGPYDLNAVMSGFEPTEHHFRFLGRTPGERSDASPVHFVHAGAPYSVLIYGTGDYYIDPMQHLRMAEALVREGVPHEVIELPYYAHSSYIQRTDIYESMLLKLLMLARERLKDDERQRTSLREPIRDCLRGCAQGPNVGKCIGL